MPMTTDYPTLKQTFAEQHDDTIPGADYPNTQSATIEGLEDWLGGQYSVAGDPNVTGRVLSLEAASPSRITYSTTQPADSPLQVWFDTTDATSWIYKIQKPDNTFIVIGANAVQIRGVDIEIGTPANGEVLAYNSGTSRLEWTAASGFTNPLTASQDIMIGTTPIVLGKATLGRLAMGTANQVLSVNTGGTALEWKAAPVTGIPPSVLTQKNGILVGGVVTSGVAAATQLTPSTTAGQVLNMIDGNTMGWSNPPWIPSPNGVVQGSILYFDSDGRWHYLPPPATNGYVLTGGIGVNPVWAAIPTSVPGSDIIAPAGSTDGALLIYSTATSSWTNFVPGTAGTYLQSTGATSAPHWTTPPTGMTNPMGGTGDIIYSSNGSGTPAARVVGSHANGEVLTLVGGVPDWAAIPNPFTVIDAAGDLLVGSADNTVTKLTKGGTNGFVLTMVAGAVAWAAPSAGFSDPMTAAGDIIIRNGSNVTARLAKQTDGQVLMLVSGVPAWANSPSGFSDPMSASGDIIIRNVSNVTTRLPKDTNGQVLTLVSGVPAWANATGGFSDPMTAIGDIIFRNGSNVTARLPVGNADEWLGITSGNLDWKPIPVFADNLNGLVTGPGSSTDLTQFLRVDGAWAAPSSDAGTIRGIVVSATAPNPDDVLTYSGTSGQWEPQPSAGGSGSLDGPLGASGTIYIRPRTLASGHWTSHNLTSTTVTDVPNGIKFELASQSGSHIRALLESPPAGATWAINTKFSTNIPGNLSSPMCGIVFRDSATGHTMYFNIHVVSGVLRWAVHHASDSDGTSETADSFGDLTYRVMPWLQVRQTATDWVYEISYDEGQNWLQLYSLTIGTNVATLDGIGPFVNPEGTSGWNAICEHWGHGAPDWAKGGNNNFGQLSLLSRPQAAVFTSGWLNQGSATITDEDDGVYLEAPANSSAGDVHCYMQPLTSGRITTLGFLSCTAPYDFASMGIVVSDGLNASTDKAVTFNMVHNGVWQHTVTHYASANASSGTTVGTNTTILPIPMLWFRIDDTGGTNFLFQVSADGIHNWVTVHSESRTAYLTAPAYVGICAVSNAANKIVGLKALHWTHV